jgi:exonuclease VII large subunit
VSLDPARVLDRGYAIVRAAATDVVLPRRAAAAAHRELTIQFADGRLPVQQAGGAARPRSAQGRRPAEQGELL